MAEEKKSVLLYCDLIHTVEKLDDQTAGKLFKHYLRYINDENPETDNTIVDIVFEPIKQNLKRDLKKWEQIKVKRSLAGQASAKKRKQNQQVLTSVENDQQTPTNSTVTVNGNVKVKENVKVKVKVITKKIDVRKTEFKNSLTPFLESYDANLLNEFYSYWTEHGIKDKKMRFEKQKSFGISRRLSTWKRNQKKFGENSNGNLTAVEKLNKKLGL